MRALFRNNSISIAVIGAPSSGKSYLLYDMIHAFHVMGYRPQELPLSYPYSSFGTFFYDIFYAGGARGTEVYACRPNNHYGAHLSIPYGYKLKVDFLNIPGECFSRDDVIRHFFNLKRRLESIGTGIFRLVTYRSPSGHEIKLITPVHGFSLDAYEPYEIDGVTIKSQYMTWNNIKVFLTRRDYKAKGHGKEITGKHLLKHMSEIMTDSVINTFKDTWDTIGSSLDEDLDFYAENVFKHFYSLTYCQNATDLVICDKLGVTTNASVLLKQVGQYLDNLKSHAPMVYLAFRNADQLIVEKSYRIMAGNNDVSSRNNLYSRFVEDIMDNLTFGRMDNATGQHIRMSVGNSSTSGFRALLKKSQNRSHASTKHEDESRVLPPHVYFTSTPIDSSFNIYINDPDNVTRFYHETADSVKSFVSVVAQDMSQHYCMGSLQLLVDILSQHRLLPAKIKKDCTKTLKYFIG